MMLRVRAGVLLLVLLAGGPLAGGPALAQEPAPERSAVAPPVVVLRANTLIPLRMMETVDSASATNGVNFSLVVTDDIFVDGRLVIPAGAVAHGEVIHSAKAGIFGKAGELSISSRYVTVGERRIRLRSLIASAGADKADLAMGVGMVVPFAPFFIRGKDLVVPAETELIARVAGDETFTFDVTETVTSGGIP